MTFINVFDIVTSDIAHIKNKNFYLYVIHEIYVMLYVYLYSAKRMIRYNPE